MHLSAIENGSYRDMEGSETGSCSKRPMAATAVFNALCKNWQERAVLLALGRPFAYSFLVASQRIGQPRGPCMFGVAFFFKCP